MAGGAGPGLPCVGVGLLRHTNNTAPHQQETHTEEFSTFLHQHSIKDPTLSNSALYVLKHLKSFVCFLSAN